MILVVGAGAAGLTAAIFAASGGHDVLVIERTTDGGRKILISGGGRCNVLPSVLAPERFVTSSPAHLMRGMLRSWPLMQQREFFERDLAIPLALEADSGKLFPASNRARDIRDALVGAARRHNVRFQFDTSLTSLTAVDGAWSVATTRGALAAARVILATGGLSVPATGSNGDGLQLAESLGHRMHARYPALTPLLSQPAVHAGLSGVSLTVRLRAKSARRTLETSGGFLFTHRGYSGPAVLDVSHVAVRDRDATIRAQWTTVNAAEWERLLTGATGLVATVVSARLPQRLATQLIDEAGIPPDRRSTELRRSERIALIDRLTAYPLPWTGDEGFKKAEVTGGGVALDEVNAQTLESLHHPGLHLCGEMLDAFGPIGGHNFAWAWATGRLAGLGAASV
ncbi:MAG TPA: aminoacetone oxidase family FAD-binding enzyme [Vicinamibacterales bacterium]|nr:aminoacetone oxidase family FAD-binding enzyme [Vicinamibacterales bacterium]